MKEPKRSTKAVKPRASKPAKPGSDKPKRRTDADPDKKRTFSREGSDKPKRREYGDSEKKRTFSKEGSSDRPKRREYGDPEKKRTFSKEGSSDRPKRREYGDPEKKRTFSREGGDDRPKRREYGDPEKKRTFSREGGDDRPKRSFRPKEGDSERPQRREYNDGDKKRPSYRKDGDRPRRDFKAPEKKQVRFSEDGKEKPIRKRINKPTPLGWEEKPYERKPKGPPTNKEANTRFTTSQPEEDGLVRLNKYIADSGICSRREADKLIETGAVMVNGNITTVLGTKVSLDDKVQVGGETISPEPMRYVLLNKPKGVISTLDDPLERNTVMSLVYNACRERIYPVGRLDRNTTGLLLLTNDGLLTKTLTHPKHGVRKVYHVVLDQALSLDHYHQIENGIELEDGFIKVDAIDYVGDGKDRRELGVEIHSGRNRIVRRIFENFGYKISKLDRVVFAGLTKKDLPRGKWRFLTPDEVSYLKMLS